MDAARARHEVAAPVRVLHVDTATTWRGGQRQLELLAAHLDAEQLLLAPAGAPLVRRFAHATEALPPVGRDAAVRRWARRFGADIVALHTRAALRLGQGLPGRVVHRRVDFPVSRWSAWHHRRAHGVVAVSDGVARVLASCGVAERVRVVHDGVAAPDPVPRTVPVGPPVLLAVGALVPHKGHRHAVEALVHLPGAELWLAGEGPLAGALRRQVAARGLQGRVRFLGSLPEPAPAFARAHLLVHPSEEEGLGQVVLEAQLAGLPVVASAVGGLPEALWGASRSVPGGDPLALAAAVRALLAALPAARARMAELRPAQAERWGAPRMAAATARAYQEVLTRGTLQPCDASPSPASS